MTMISDRLAALCCAFAMVFWCAAGGLMFRTSAEENEGSLTLWCAKDEDVVADMHWQIYRVGHREANDYVFEGPFAEYRATLGDRSKPMLEWSNETVAAAGETLKLKTIVDEIPFRSEGVTNKNGTLTFSGLEDGLYLVWGDILEKGNLTYIPSALFFEMNGEDSAFLNAYPKIILRDVYAGGNNYSVKKIWDNDEDQLWNRNVPIIVDIYRDEELYEEVTLSEDNDWTYSWEDREEHSWFVYEKDIPGNYTVAYRSNETQFIIVNTYDDVYGSTGTTTTTTTTSVTTTTTTTSTNTISDSGSGTTGTKTTTVKPGTTTVTTVKPGDKLPQTGQLWWPVIPMACGGVLLLGIGARLGKKDDEE
ncbi:MAG: Cna B-type domain-containing protein [Ruminococcus sp.]|nr:Cna B-type domain-containing protein [Ruminococcus sp.]